MSPLCVVSTVLLVQASCIRRAQVYDSNYVSVGIVEFWTGGEVDRT
jgi:hypothetical protein